MEELGFRALWIPDVGGRVFDAVDRLLAFGFSSDDLSSVSDRPLDAIIACGYDGAITRKIDPQSAGAPPPPRGDR